MPGERKTLKGKRTLTIQCFTQYLGMWIDSGQNLTVHPCKYADKVLGSIEEREFLEQSTDSISFIQKASA